MKKSLKMVELAVSVLHVISVDTECRPDKIGHESTGTGKGGTFMLITKAMLLKEMQMEELYEDVKRFGDELGRPVGKGICVSGLFCRIYLCA